MFPAVEVGGAIIAIAIDIDEGVGKDDSGTNAIFVDVRSVVGLPIARLAIQNKQLTASRDFHVGYY